MRDSSIQSAIEIGHHLCRKQLRRRRGEPHAHEERHIPRVRWMCRAGNAGDAGTRLRAAVRARRRKHGEAADFTQLREDVKGLMKKEPNVGPTLVRLAWHSCGTYDKMTKTGGSGGGTIRFKEELAHGNNAGLDKMVALLEPVKSKHPSISYADMYAYAGKVAIEEMGGPTLQFKYGRVDEMDPSKVTPDGRLPDADKGDHAGPKTTQGLRDVFYRMGFDDREIVALSGAHALGRCHADASGYVGPWSSTPLLFNNSYYGLLKGLKWTENKKDEKIPIRRSERSVDDVAFGHRVTRRQKL